MVDSWLMRLLQACREGEGDGEEGDEHDAQRAEVERKQGLRRRHSRAGPRMISLSRSRGVRAGGAVAIGSVSVWTNAASLCTAMSMSWRIVRSPPKKTEYATGPA